MVTWSGQLGSKVAHVFAHPDHYRHVLQDHVDQYRKGGMPVYEAMRTIIGDGLLLSEGDAWRAQRRLARPAFHRQRIAGFAAILTQATDRMLERWGERVAVAASTVDLMGEMNRLTLETVTETLVGRVREREFDALVRTASLAVRHCVATLRQPVQLPERWPTPLRWRMRRALAETGEIVARVIAAGRQGRADEGHLLSMLLHARAVGGACRVLERARLLEVELHEEGMLEAARRRTGLSDFGDPSFEEALGTLLRSLREEADLDLIGRFAIRNWCIDLLSNRLEIQQQLTRHPEILDVPIRRPLFVIGWPRTGTTLLQKLLAAQSGARPLLFWEQFAPAPPADLASSARDPRVREAHAFIRNLRAISPTIDVTHPIAATEPEECNGLFQNSFVTPLGPVSPTRSDPTRTCPSCKR